MTRWLVLAVLAVAATAAHGQAIVLSACGTGAFTVGQLHQLTMDPLASATCVRVHDHVAADNGHGSPVTGSCGSRSKDTARGSKIARSHS